MAERDPKTGKFPKRPPLPSTGLPAMGPGWGGDKADKGRREAFTAETQPPAEHKRAGHVEAKEYRERLAEKHAKALQAYEDAWDSGNPMAAMTATKQWEARMYGDPKQTIDVSPPPKTKEELLAEVEAAKKAAGLA